MGQEQSQDTGKDSDSVNSVDISKKRTTRKSSTVKQKAKLEDIIVVKDTPDAGDNVDGTMRKLEKLAIICPIIKNVGGMPLESVDILPGLDSDPVTEMLLRYQYHLTECAEAVAFDQNAIGKRMKEIEVYSSTVLKGAIERQKQMDSLLINMKKFTEIDSLIDRVGKNIDKTVKLMHNINKFLPESEQFSADELDVKNANKNIAIN